MINDIWFDFANIMLLTIYFFSYGNPINSKNINVSFSQTKSLEKTLLEYTKMKQRQKYLMKKAEDEDEDIIDNMSISDIAADDSKEYCMGSTYYLDELKSEIFLYSFTRKCKYFFFIGLQIFTLITTITFAFLCKSWLSWGYLLMAIPLIVRVTDFFRMDALQQEGSTWKQPFMICGPLIIYCFIDIAIQVTVGALL